MSRTQCIRTEILLVVDAMTGQDAVNVAENIQRHVSASTA